MLTRRPPQITGAVSSHHFQAHLFFGHDLKASARSARCVKVAKRQVPRGGRPLCEGRPKADSFRGAPVALTPQAGRFLRGGARCVTASGRTLPDGRFFPGDGRCAKAPRWPILEGGARCVKASKRQILSGGARCVNAPEWQIFSEQIPIQRCQNMQTCSFAVQGCGPT